MGRRRHQGAVKGRELRVRRQRAFGSPRLRQPELAIFDAEPSDDEDYFDAIDAKYPAGGFVLPESAKQAHVLYLGVTDDAGEHPILGFEIAEGGWVKYPSFASFLADYFGVVPTKKQTGFADALKAQTARLAKPKPKVTAAAKPVKAARKKSDEKLETAPPALSGGAADALQRLVAILAEAPSKALDAALKRSHASVEDARGKFVDVRKVLPSGAALVEALGGGGSARLFNAVYSTVAECKAACATFPNTVKFNVTDTTLQEKKAVGCLLYHVQEASAAPADHCLGDLAPDDAGHASMTCSM